MSLFNEIKADQLAARKAGNSLAASLLTTLIGEAAAIGKNDGNRDVTDTEVIALVKKFVDRMDETLGYLGASNPTATATVNSEKEILGKYLPTQLTDDQLSDEIQAIVERIRMTATPNMGTVMAALKTDFGGRYDGKKASNFVKAALV